MNARELRIGNIALDPLGEIIEVSARHVLEQRQSDNAKTPYLSGVFLTEEWLLKFGFEKGYSDYYEYVVYSNGIFAVAFQDDQFYFAPDGELGWTIYNNLVPIKYVHQLQNLYVATEGEELEQ